MVIFFIGIYGFNIVRLHIIDIVVYRIAIFFLPTYILIYLEFIIKHFEFYCVSVIITNVSKHVFKYYNIKTVKNISIKYLFSYLCTRIIRHMNTFSNISIFIIITILISISVN